MKKRIIRAALMVLAVITVFGAAYVFPSRGENDEANETQNIESYAPDEETDEVISSDSLPEVLGFVDSVSTGGSNYVNSAFNEAIAAVRDLFLPLGYCIMFVCWIIGMCKSGMSLNFDPGAKDGIIRSGLSLLLGLFLMDVSMEIMESLSSLCWHYCAQLNPPTKIASFMISLLPGVEESALSLEALFNYLTFLDDIAGTIKIFGATLLFWIVEAVLVLNVAYMGLLQCFSPIFVGFAAGGEGTRRFAMGFFKEYMKVCLVPPVITVYLALCFNLFLSSSVGWFLCIVLGISIFGITKKLDKIIS